MTPYGSRYGGMGGSGMGMGMGGMGAMGPAGEHHLLQQKMFELVPIDEHLVCMYSASWHCKHALSPIIMVKDLHRCIHFPYL